MTNSELFKAAHAITKQVIKEGDDYRATFAAAIKTLRAKPVDMQKALTGIGGSLWEKTGMRRIYFNDLARFMGLSVSYYKTGNISSARLNGEHISNSAAGRMLSSIDKLWFDLDAGQFFFKGTDRDLAIQVIKNIRAQIA